MIIARCTNDRNVVYVTGGKITCDSSETAGQVYSELQKVEARKDLNLTARMGILLGRASCMLSDAIPAPMMYQPSTPGDDAPLKYPTSPGQRIDVDAIRELIEDINALTKDMPREGE